MNSKIDPENLKKYQEENNIQVKCISDKILLYLRYIIDTDPLFKKEKQESFEFEKSMMRIYYLVRGEPEFTNQKPLRIVASIIYVLCIMYGYNKTQKDICDMFGVSISSIRTNYQLIRDKLKPQS